MIYIYLNKKENILFASERQGMSAHMYQIKATFEKGKYVSRLKSKDEPYRTRYLCDNNFGGRVIYLWAYGRGRNQLVEKMCSAEEWLKFSEKAKRVGNL